MIEQSSINKPVSFEKVEITDFFWAPRIKANREQTIPEIYRFCKETGRIDALKLKWKTGDEPKPHVFWDSDIAKWLEAACYSLASLTDHKLSGLVDEVVDLIVAAQQPDGYINSYFSVVEPHKRFIDLRDAHELYCAGHLIEAAIAHFQIDGSRKLLDAVCRYADYINNVFGKGTGQKRGYCGHPEIELALVRLFYATGELRYLELSRYFIDERGNQPNYFDQEKIAHNGAPSHFEQYFNESGRKYTHEYNQSHKPVWEQNEVTGHAVRAMYLYSAMVDLAIEYKDSRLMEACERLWHHLSEKLMYITGGIGSSDRNEGFTFDYDLPNETAYCETCASIGLVFWNHRLLQADCDGRYTDMLEKALYNGVCSGVSLDGRRFFYDNPLASSGEHHRKEWFDVSCCPANLSRLLTTLGQYIYSYSQADAIIHLYVQGTGHLCVNGKSITLRQSSNYPWDGHVIISVEPEKAAFFGIKLRIPGWCRKATLQVNDKNIPIIVDKGYVRIEREWEIGDVIELKLDMPVERVYAHPEVKFNRNRVAIQRGPIVYCIEEVDNCKDLDTLLLPRESELKAALEPDLLSGVVSVQGVAQKFDMHSLGDQLYRLSSINRKIINIKAVPYCTWDNRDPGKMLVWLRET